MMNRERSKKMMSMMLTVVLTLIMVIGTMSFPNLASEVVFAATNGTCGENLNWTLDDEGTLTISGTGEMTSSPWEKSDVKNVVIGNGVTSIEDYAFYYCDGLTSITIPNSVTSIGDGAFHGCSGLTSVTIPNSVTSIGNWTFFGCSGLTSVTIPNSVTSIGYYAFSGCSKLTSVTIPNSVTSIGDSAFQYCSSLKSITIPNSVMSIGNSAFYECSGLTSVTIPNIMTSIGNSAFYGCNGLTSITIPGSVTSIGSYAFKYCIGLKSVTIPNSVTSIGDSAFESCSGLTSVTIPNSVTSIEDRAFESCSGLTSVTIPNSVTSIRSHAFQYCRGLKSITIPNSVTSIGEGAFSECSGLTSIAVNTGNSIYASDDGVLLNKTKTEIICCPGGKTGSYSIPNSVTSIGENAFYYSGLTSVTIPNSVTSIEDRAFYCSGLTSVTIPNSVTSIGERAFFDCSGLTSVTIPNSVTSIGDYAFSNCDCLSDIYYGGSEYNWGWIAIGAGNEFLTSATIHYNSTGPINEHTHSYNYTASGNTITATCVSTGCSLANNQATLTINAPSNLAYDGNEKASTITGSIPGIETPVIVYKQGSAAMQSAPVNVGSYTASITLEGVSASIVYTITKGSHFVTSVPKAKSGLLTNGQMQELVVAGTATGTIKYALGANGTTAPEDNTFSESIPKAKDVGTYYVWYYVTGDGNYYDTEKKCIEVTVTDGGSDPAPAPTPEEKKPGEDTVADNVTQEATSKPVTLAGSEVTAKIETTYEDAVDYTGSKITPKSQMSASADLSDLASKFTTKKKYTSEQLLKVSYVTSGKKVGEASFYAKITLDEKKAKKAGLTKKQIAEIKALIKAVNEAEKSNPCVYRIVPVSLTDARVTVKATWKKSGKIRKVISVKVKTKVNGKNKTFTLKKSDYDIAVVDAKTKTVSVTGKGNFTGSAEVVTKK